MTLRWWSLALLVVVAAACSRADPAPAVARSPSPLEAGFEAQRNGDHEAALRVFRAVAEGPPANTIGWALSAETLHRMGRRSESEQAFVRALSIGGDEEFPLVLRTYLRAAEGETAAALADAEEAIRVAPRSHFSYLALSVVHAYEGRLPEAIREVDRALTRKPDDALLLTGRGCLYAAQGRLEPALEDLRKAAAKDPTVSDSGLWYFALTGDRTLAHAARPRSGWPRTRIEFARGELGDRQLIAAAEARGSRFDRELGAAEAHLLVALVADREGRSSAAQEHYRAAASSPLRSLDVVWARRRLIPAAAAVREAP